jgi:glutamine synthetase
MVRAAFAVPPARAIVRREIVLTQRSSAMNEGGERLRLLWSDLLGLARGKYLLHGHHDDPAHFCVTTFSVGHDLNMVPMPGYGADVGMPDMVARLDPDSVRRGWEPSTKVAMSFLETDDGEAVALDPRRCLANAIEAWRAEGFEPQLGYEMELYLMDRGADGSWHPVAAPAHRVYGTGTASDPTGLTSEVVSVALDAGLPVEAFSGEYSTAQMEVNLRYGPAMRATDDAFYFRVLAKEVAEAKGVGLTFLGLPFNGHTGNGLHVNLSFCRRDGTNALEGALEGGLSELALQCVAGVLEHHESLAAFCAPTVNAYKRLQPAMIAGYYANWGLDNRTATVRIPPPRGVATRLEHRMADGAANPYLVAAALLWCCLFGVRNKLEPPRPQEGDADTEANTTRTCPRTLDAALDARVADKELVSALDQRLVDAFVALKRAEAQRYATTVTDWELREYLPFY